MKLKAKAYKTKEKVLPVSFRFNEDTTNRLDKLATKLKRKKTDILEELIDAAYESNVEKIKK